MLLLDTMFLSLVPQNSFRANLVSRRHRKAQRTVRTAALEVLPPQREMGANIVPPEQSQLATRVLTAPVGHTLSTRVPWSVQQHRWGIIHLCGRNQPCRAQQGPTAMHLAWQGACDVGHRWDQTAATGLRTQVFPVFVIRDAPGAPCARRTTTAPVVSVENALMVITNQGKARQNALTWTNVQLAAARI